jgi:hypothetical protein
MDSKRIAGGLVALAGSALAGEWIVRGADMALSLFYHAGVIDWSAIRSGVGLLALAGGLYFLFRPSNQAEAEQKRLILVERIVALQRELEQHGLEKSNHQFGEVISVYTSLRRLKIATPDTRKKGDWPLIFGEAYTYLTNIMPMVRDGHLAEARYQAPNIIACLHAPDNVTEVG